MADDTLEAVIGSNRPAVDPSLGTVL
jgi:hypothetical protein